MLISTYARVSSDRQEKEQTIESQVAALKEYARENGHTIVKEYQDDGWSGAILARPALDQLRDDATRKIWEGVLIYDPDRLARKYSYQELVTDELDELGIKVLFVTTPSPKTDEDRIMNGFRGLFAEYERFKIAERMRRGKLHKARKGNVVTSKSPYGYTYVSKQGNHDGYYKINKQEAEVVKMVFCWVAEEGLTIRKVVRRLQKLDIPPRTSKRGVWNTSTLSTLLRNETYIGRAHYNRSYAVLPQNPLKHEQYKKVKKTSRKIRPRKDWIQISVPAIISEGLFNRTREQLKASFELCQRNKKNKYLLAGKIYCICGRRRSGEGPQRGKHLYYRCTDRVYSFPLPPNCKRRGINARIADKLVWDGVSGYMSNPDLVKEQARRWLKTKQEKHQGSESSLEELKVELKKLKNEEQRYIKVYGEGLISEHQLQEAMNDLRIRRVVLERQIGYMTREGRKADIILPEPRKIEEFSKKARQTLGRLFFEKRQAILRKVVDKVVGDQKELTVYGYLPIEESENVKFWSNCRYRRFTQRRKVDTF